MLVAVPQWQTRSNHVGVVDGLHLRRQWRLIRIECDYLVDIIPVNPFIKSLVQDVQHGKQLKRIAGTGYVIEIFNL